MRGSFSGTAAEAQQTTDRDDAEILSSCRVNGVSYSSESRGSFECTIDSIQVSLAANRIDDLAYAGVVEFAAAAVGKHHLFKRTLVLVQVL